MTARATRRGLLALAPSAALMASSSATGTPHPDAELIALCAEHVRNRAAYDRDGGYLEPEVCALWQAYERTHDAISAAKPRTTEGMLAKARVAKMEARRPDGCEDPEHGPGATWAWDLVNDLIRLHGRPA